MKDYDLVRYIAKKQKLPQKSKTLLYITTPYGDCEFMSYIRFVNKQSVCVSFDLEDVHAAYGEKFGSLRDFLAHLESKYSFFEVEEFGKDLFLKCDISSQPFEHVASQALATITVMIKCLNETLKRKEDVYAEDAWRSFHRDLLSDRLKTSKLAFGASVLGLIASIALFIVSNSHPYLGLLSLLLLGPASLVGLILFGIKKRLDKKELQRASENRR